MRFPRLLRSACNFTRKLFHKRSIIVISEHDTNHFAVSGKIQFCIMMLAASSIAGVSYFTGNYMAAKTTLAEKDQTLKSVANSRIDTNFQYFGPTLQPQNLAPVAQGFTPPLTDPSYSFTALDQDKLVARIAFLETRVRELKTTNETIIHTVREKANGKIADLEDVIRKTGLDPKQLQNKEASLPEAKAKGEGGPFIAADLSQSAEIPSDLFAPLDRLAALDRIVDKLPLAMPVRGASPNSLFGRRIDPFNGRLAFHAGVDLVGPPGAKVQATNAGQVTSAGWNGAYGNTVDINHGYGIVTRYGHLSEIRVREGEQVAKGHVIGIQGSTGRSTGAHVHYEVRYNDRPLNPLNFLQAQHYVSKE